MLIQDFQDILGNLMKNISMNNPQDGDDISNADKNIMLEKLSNLSYKKTTRLMKWRKKYRK